MGSTMSNFSQLKRDGDTRKRKQRRNGD